MAEPIPHRLVVTSVSEAGVPDSSFRIAHSERMRLSHRPNDDDGRFIDKVNFHQTALMIALLPAPARWTIGNNPAWHSEPLVLRLVGHESERASGYLSFCHMKALLFVLRFELVALTGFATR